MAEFITPVTLELDGKKIPYRVFTHPGMVHSLEQAAFERGQRPGQVVRSILFRLNEGEFVMVLVAGPQQISWPLLRDYLRVSRMSMASPGDVLARTGYPTGAVSPFGLPEPVRILVDESVFAEEEVSIGSGVRNTTVILRREDLKMALGDFEVGRFTESRS
jgi:prolyl-tRNA editing enzyme YbaK/EbsC (Cys-tRNA(Pro) deacylase)